jgi:hypothetical protein
METQFYPTQEDVGRYLRLRQARENVSIAIANDIPPQAYDDIGEALGLIRDRVPVIDSEIVDKTLAECCLYDWYKKGKNLVQRHAEAHPAPPGSDEHYVLNAMRRAQSAC